MKRLISLLCALCLLFSFAFAEDYATTNPYTIDDIGMTLALPDVLSVTSCDVLYGYTITVVGGTSADSFDDDTYGAAFNLYWSTVTSFVDCMTEE